MVDLGVQFADRSAVPASRPWLAVWEPVDRPVTAGPAAAAPDADAPAPPAAAGPRAWTAGDWYERVSDEDVAIALRNDFDGTLALLIEALGNGQATETARQLSGLAGI